MSAGRCGADTEGIAELSCAIERPATTSCSPPPARYHRPAMIKPFWKFIVLALAGWMNRQQQEAIEYLQTENRILREKLGQKRIRLNDSQTSTVWVRPRRSSAVPCWRRSARCSRRTRCCAGTAGSSPASMTGLTGEANAGPSPRRPTRSASWSFRWPRTIASWGYGHITGELKGLGFDVHWQTVRRVMLDHGLLPDPDRPYKTTWKEFLKSHWESLAACDFFCVATC